MTTKPPGPGSFGGGRGTDYRRGPEGTAAEDNGGTDVAGEGRGNAGKDERPVMGWGGRGENYPPTQGPMRSKEERRRGD